MRLLFLLFAACLVAPFTARSQKVKVELANEREHFLAGENIPLTIRISNFSGRTLVLGNDAEWLSLTVTSPTRKQLDRVGELPSRGSFAVPSGSTVSRTIDISAAYNFLQQIGRAHV